VASWLREAGEAGTPIAFLHGNRDFLVGERFCQRAGMRLMAQPAMLDLHETPTVVLHGDTLCTLDAAYQRYRRRVSDPDWQARMLARPVWFRRSVARLLRLASRFRNRDADRPEMDVAPTAVDALFAETGAERMIHGHTHRPDRHVHRVGGLGRERIVLGDWYTQGSVLAVGSAGAELRALAR
jgi:UDP-2,3-diacylglucosamine hydrolase